MAHVGPSPVPHGHYRLGGLETADLGLTRVLKRGYSWLCRLAFLSYTNGCRCPTWQGDPTRSSMTCPSWELGSVWFGV
ncbi:LOW QUALITY PROTEIN: hypothetical protein TorRG33x02_340900 [Trema orientale]|uniref:Uncharacterized protein n=1 Tax=Trema orientale TaxID=63057 RepID=A0A2P5AUK0_TREOI|nr:LOW QUALITY PROTEIN: hypothetical protein TorRG33x02_340900 [Trema orientale]